VITTQLYRKHYLSSAVLILAFILLGFFVSHALMKLSSHRPFPPPIFFAKLIDEINPGNRVLGLNRIEKLNSGSLPFKFALIDQDGKNLSSTGIDFVNSWQKIQKPSRNYEFQANSAESQLGPPGPPLSGFVRLPGSVPQYLYIYFDDKLIPPPFLMFLVTTVSLILSVLLGVGFSLFLMFRALHLKIDLADSVIAELQRGNLKARFPIKKMDEIGQAMSRFNKMADEIERLVEQLKMVEKSRMTLLQELAHDLRTPIASLKNLLVTIQKKNETSEKELRDELISISQKEVEYFERLVEDLLVLAQVSEPKHTSESALVNINEILNDEVESVGTLHEYSNKNISIQRDEGTDSVAVRGDQHLIHRMFRNCLDNALSFAKSEVTVILRINKERRNVEIVVQDNGPGFSEKALGAFGERRISRALGTEHENRISVGLGSVIMKTVARIHRGTIQVENRTLPPGQIVGAQITISLPVEHLGSG